LKTFPLLILLTLLLIPAGFAQTPEQSPESSVSAFGIEPGKLYQGKVILELMETADEELTAAVDEAYAEGYKAGVIRYAPEAALYTALAADMEKAMEAERKKSRYFWPVLGVSAGVSFVAGLLCSFLLPGR
jgi:hypothetical protein